MKYTGLNSRLAIILRDGKIEIIAINCWRSGNQTSYNTEEVDLTSTKNKKN